MSRHRAPDPDDETTIIPRVQLPADDSTSVIPAITGDATMQLPQVKPSPTPRPETAKPIPSVVSGRAVATDETGILGRILPRPPEDETPPAAAEPREKWSGEPPPPPVKAIKAGDRWRSIHSEYTRTTVGSVIRTTLRGAGEVMITFGLVLLLFAAYEVWGKPAIVDAHQDELSQRLDEIWALPDPTVSATPSPGPTATPQAEPELANAIAKLYIPRMNKHWVVVEGVSQADIRYAPGHYPDTAMPGQTGNFSVAGHRNRATFWDLDKVQKDDYIIVETRTTWYIYQVVLTRVVIPSQVEVVSPHPPKVGKDLDTLLTLTTCNPKLDNYERLIVHATLDDQTPRSGPRPWQLES